MAEGETSKPVVKTTKKATKKQGASPRFPDDPYIVRNKRGKLVRLYPCDLDKESVTRMIDSKQLEIIMKGKAVSEMRGK